MSDGDVPPFPTIAPLGRLRAQLAGPRGVRRIDELISSDDAAAAVAALAPPEIYELVHEVGFEEAGDLLALATPAQFQGCIDLDAWSGDSFELAPLRPWLTAAISEGFEKIGEVFGGLDEELRALILQRQSKIYDTTLGEEPPEDSEIPTLTTPDRWFLVELHGEDDDQRLLMRLVEDLYRADADLARQTIMSARVALPAELEETAYRWRTGRLADLGYVDFYEALELFRPLEAAQVHIGEGSQDLALLDSGHLPLAVAEEVIGRSFLARALASIEETAEAERVEGAIMLLVNRVLAAARVRPGQAEVVQRGALYGTATLSLGLETVSRGDLIRARDALRTVALGRLFRVGYTVTQKLARLAQALAPRSVTSGSPARELVASLCSPRPLFARAAEEPPAAGIRPFESAADLRRAGEVLSALALRIALVESLGVDVIATSLAPEPRPQLDDHIRTALARAVVGGAFSGEALSQGELRALRAAMPDGGLTLAARIAGLAAVRAKLGAQHAGAADAIAVRLVDAWLADLEGMLGDVTDAEIDPRFVEGVLVQVNRS